MSPDLRIPTVPAVGSFPPPAGARRSPGRGTGLRGGSLAALALAASAALAQGGAGEAPATAEPTAPPGAGRQQAAEAGAPPDAGRRPAPAPAGDASRGRRLFSGEARFEKGGPPCGACHATAGLPFPGGGTMGPDLTGTYDKFGPEPLDLALTTLFFPTMNPVFAGRALEPGERADLVAFLASSAKQAPPTTATLRTLLLGAAVLAVLVVAMAALGRKRLRGVRATLVASSRRREVGRP